MEMDDLWHDAHAIYDNANAYSYRSYVERSPYAGLLADNHFISLLRNPSKVTLLHITTSIQNIEASGKILSSGGCLVGSIYCTTLQESHGLFRPHNLGSFIHEQEVQQSLSHKGLTERRMTPLIIEVDTRPLTKSRPSGVNYLKLGAIHLATYLQLRDRLMQRDMLEDAATQKARAALPFLELCATSERLVDTDNFFSELVKAIPHVPILGYMYFEAITEYIMLFSEDERSLGFAAIHEINCWGYKQFIFRVQPSLLTRFNLGDFNPPLPEVLHTIDALSGEKVLKLDTRDFVQSVYKRLRNLVQDCLLPGGASSEAINRIRRTKSFDALAESQPHLTGHIIDRELRVVSRYDGFHYDFDRYKAESVWNYWTKFGILFPFNGIMPKGEVGFNPSHQNAPYTIHIGKPRYENGDLFFEKDRKLSLAITPEIVHPKQAFMGITAPHSGAAQT